MDGATGFHAGELAVQQRAGTRGEAQRLAGMLDEPDLRGGVGHFLAERTLAGLVARDTAGRLWISPLTGAPGFLDATGATTLRVHSVPGPGDPLRGLPVGQPVGLLAIEFARRRRVRANGTLAAVGPSGLTVEVEQAYGNCPQYIQQRVLDAVPAAAPEYPGEPVAVARDALDPDDMALVAAADTFLLGTTHPERGNDASHRGGSPGFVRVAGPHRLWWPDYPGNNMFNSFGNLEVDPTAALVFVDFATGRTLHLSGTARVEWSATGPGDDGGTGRRVWFEVEAVVAGSADGLRADAVEPYRRNPALT
ncbi:pyridoxamine 5'-phosphate oxidase family protein [Actinomycetospora sp.]|uniref:pyridoxamine 5'-phosphate oxidase family protein n=1 Tax=Actinomycetospora sp. TaxID=1872135 RepID=UPI002F3FB853